MKDGYVCRKTGEWVSKKCDKRMGLMGVDMGMVMGQINYYWNKG